MSSITMTGPSKGHPNLRPLNIFRDLPSVADLIEICFANTMDSEGRRYVQDMRKASFTKWAARTVESTALPLSGFVWEENGEVVGNVSLVPFRFQKQKIYLIANIATAPAFRRRGIARALTEHAVQYARERKAEAIWLHVRDDNPGAIQLYSQLGFVERARRTTWQAQTDSNAQMTFADITVSGRTPHDWPLQLNWLKRLYPDGLAWHRYWNFNHLRPGFLSWLYLFFLDIEVRQWSAMKGNNTEAFLSWIPSGRGESLFVATGERSDPEALTALLLQARRELSHFYPRVLLEFPAGQFEQAIQSAGFQSLRTLIWMQATS